MSISKLHFGTLAAALMLFGHPAFAATQCIGYGAEGTLEEQFDQCLAGEWGEEGCTAGRTIRHAGFSRAEGEACTISYLIRDPHTGGFRLTWECRDSESGEETERSTEVWIVEDGARRVGDSVTGYPIRDYRCEMADAHD